MVTYSESGVDIDLEAVTVSALADKLKSTLECRDIITDSGHYAALVKLGDKAIAMSTDGVGSKILIAEMMNKYDTVGIAILLSKNQTLKEQQKLLKGLLPEQLNQKLQSLVGKLHHFRALLKTLTLQVPVSDLWISIKSLPAKTFSLETF